MKLIKSFVGGSNPTFTVELDLSEIQNADVVVTFVDPMSGFTESKVVNAYVKSTAPVTLSNNGNVFPGDTCYVEAKITPIAKPHIIIYEEVSPTVTVEA